MTGKRKPRIKTRPRVVKKQAKEPKNERDKLFCERWLVHHNHNKAIVEAGYSDKNANGLGLQKLVQFRPYLERLRPKVELEVAKKISYERADILEAIAAIGQCNVIDYIEPYTTVNAETGMAEERWALKPIQKLTRAQASAVDSVYYDMTTGLLGYHLPKAKTRLTALTTLGEQAANFKKPGTTHNHLHLGENISLEKIRAVKQMFVDLMGPKVTREILGWDEKDQAEA